MSDGYPGECEQRGWGADACGYINFDEILFQIQFATSSEQKTRILNPEPKKTRKHEDHSDFGYFDASWQQHGHCNSQPIRWVPATQPTGRNKECWPFPQKVSRGEDCARSHFARPNALTDSMSTHTSMNRILTITSVYDCCVTYIMDPCTNHYCKSKTDPDCLCKCANGK